MSVLEDIRTLEDRLTSRLQELRPLVEEYRELERAARKLGIDPSKVEPARRRGTTAGAGRSGTTRRSRASSRRSAARNTSRVTRRDQVLALVKQRPGITVPELGAELKVDPTGLYRVVNGLAKEGAVKKEGKAVRPV